MTNIAELQKDKAKKIENKKQEDLNMATLHYQKQKNAIDGIRDTEWFKIIKDFWILQEKQATKDLKNVRFSDLQEFWRVQAKANISEKFIWFLDNLES